MATVEPERIFEDCLAALGIDRAGLARRMGFGDVETTVRIIDRFVAHPIGKGPLARRLIAALGREGERFEVALDLWLEGRESFPKKKRTFWPVVRIMTLPPPRRSVSIMMVMGHFLTRRVSPDWSELPLEEGCERVRAFYAVWCRRHPEARSPGFVWARNRDEFWEFDAEGKLLGRYGRGYPIDAVDLLPGGRRARDLPPDPAWYADCPRCRLPKSREPIESRGVNRRQPSADPAVRG